MDSNLTIQLTTSAMSQQGSTAKFGWGMGQFHFQQLLNLICWNLRCNPKKSLKPEGCLLTPFFDLCLRQLLAGGQSVQRFWVGAPPIYLPGDVRIYEWLSRILNMVTTTKLAMATMCKMSAVKHRTRNLRPRYLNSRNTEMAWKKMILRWAKV